MLRRIGCLMFTMPMLAGVPSKSRGFQVGWVSQVVVVSTESSGAGWSTALLMPGRVLVLQQETAPVPPKRAKSSTPGATVEVTEALMEDSRSRVHSFVSNLQPSLIKAFRVGETNSASSQMLSEFMAMSPDHTTPPSIPPVFYNCLVPEALKNGITVNGTSGGWLHMSASPNPRQHIALYPRR